MISLEHHFLALLPCLLRGWPNRVASGCCCCGRVCRRIIVLACRSLAGVVVRGLGLDAELRQLFVLQLDLQALHGGQGVLNKEVDVG